MFTKKIASVLSKSLPNKSHAELMELADIIELSACAACLTSQLPGLTLGIVVAMYVSLSKKLNMGLSKSAVKPIAAVILGELASYGLVALATSWIPVAGNVTQMAFTYLAGIFYVKLLAHFFNADKKPENMSESKLKEAIRACMSKEEAIALLKEICK